MPIEFQPELARLYGVVAVDDAEVLLAWLQATPGAVDLSACRHLHPAVLQVLLCADAPLAAWPDWPPLRAWLCAVFGAPLAVAGDFHSTH